LSTAGLVATRSRDEMIVAIGGLSAADWGRLRKIARRCAPAGLMSPDDLLQETMMRALSTRQCPVDVDVVRFLAEAMRSIADGERAKMKHVAELVPVAGTGGSTDDGLDLPDGRGGPEAELMTKQQEEGYRATSDAIRALFADDSVALDVLDGISEGMEPADICEVTGLDRTAYASKRRLIRRRIDKAYPAGWKP
jgi:RNA polymerase sigma-70 factor (ECF subfamily)